MHAKIINGQVEKYPYYYNELKTDYPNISFPDISEVGDVYNLPDLSSFGFVKLLPAPQPDFNYDTQILKNGSPEFKDGNWYETWVIEEIPEHEIISNNQYQLEQIKKIASNLLSETDYLDLPNTSNKISNIEEIIEYRNTLRVIAINPESNIDFPPKPQIIWVL